MTNVFEFRGTPEQQQVAADALTACNFPFDLLLPGMAAKGWTSIPVEWADLSRSASVLASEAHPVENRAGTLGLYWYKGLIQLDQSLLPNDAALAMTVMIAEAAHAVDDCYISEDQRNALVVAFHPSGPDADAWFDTGDYGTWMGEALMSAMVKTYAPSLDNSLFDQFTHQADPAVVREILTPAPETVPEPLPESDPTPTPPPAPEPVPEAPASDASFQVSLPAAAADRVRATALRTKREPEDQIVMIVKQRYRL